MENVISQAVAAMRARFVVEREGLRQIAVAYPLMDLSHALVLLDVMIESLEEATGHAIAGDEPYG